MRAKKSKNDMDYYFQGEGRHPLLTHDQVVALAESIEKGKEAQEKLDMANENGLLLDAGQAEKLARAINAGKKAKDSLIVLNRRLVVSISKGYAARYPNVEWLDLIQEGTMGLFEAVDRFDWKRGVKFATYATYWIKRFIQRAFDEQTKTIRIPTYMARKVSKYRAIKIRLSAELNRKPLLEEIAFEMGLKAQEVRYIRKIAMSIFSLETLVADDSETSWRNLIEQEREPPSFQSSENLSLKEVLNKAFAKLTGQERKILSLRFGLDDGIEHTLVEIAKEFDVTKERIRQIQMKTLEKLRYQKIISRLE